MLICNISEIHLWNSFIEKNIQELNVKNTGLKFKNSVAFQNMQLVDKSTGHICLAVFFSIIYYTNPCDRWVPVNTAWRVLRLQMEERPPIWRVAVNILNKQSRTADKVWSSSLGVGRGANNSSP